MSVVVITDWQKLLDQVTNVCLYIFSTVPGSVAKEASVCTDAEGGAGS